MAQATRKELEDGQGSALKQLPKPTDFTVPLLTMVPGQSTLYPWVLFTTSFVEETVLSFLFAGAIILFSGRYCEPMWGSTELCRFVALVTIIPNIISGLFSLLEFSIHHGVNAETGDSIQLNAITGSVSLISGFFVAFKQMIPEHTILLFKGALKIRIAWLPILYLSLYTILFGLFLYHDTQRIIQVWSGFFVSWIYLRFYRVSFADPLLPFSSSGASTIGTGSPKVTNNSASSGGIKIKGDISDSFALSQFFPEPFATAVSFISDKVYATFVLLRICTEFDLAEVDASNIRAANRASGGYSYVVSNSNLRNINFQSSYQNQQTNSNGAPVRGGSTRAEAERRRALALKVLDGNAVRGGTSLPNPNSSLNSGNISGLGTDSKPAIEAGANLQLPNRAVLPPARVN